MRERATEIVQIAVPVLIEAIAVVLFLGMLAVWCAIGAGA